MPRLILAALLLAASAVPASAQEKRTPVTVETLGPKVVFLGDSNTFAGLWVAYLDGYLRTRFPEKRYELINLGLPSETVSGLSEADHPYPRPDVHERMGRALAKTRPDTVVICYGMNDGIYAPFDEGRFAKYREGIEEVVRRCEKAGARVVLMTPAPFDPLPLKKVVQPAGAAKYSWVKPYEKYDDVLTRYSEWLLTWRDKGYAVADAHGRVAGFLSEVRKAEPGYYVSGDGIHPNPTGHALIAMELLQTLRATPSDSTVSCNLKGAFFDEARFALDDKGLTFRGALPLPMPADPRWDERLMKQLGGIESLTRSLYFVRGFTTERAELSEGDDILGIFSGPALAKGIDLARLPANSIHRRTAELGKLAQKRERLIGLAWLDEVGHKRPDTPKGLPLAEAQKQADALGRQMHDLAQPRAITLRLRKK